MNANSERLRDPRQRADRATRILDVAADQLLRHGYRRVTIDDVAAGAGIGKGTVYLHWKTREQLFGAVFEREVRNAIGELARALRQDAQVCLLHNFARTNLLAILDRPLLRGFLLGDPALLGKLTNSPDVARDDRHDVMMREYLALLAEHRLIRDDMTADDLAYAYQAIFEGFLRAESSAPSGSQAHRADLLAQVIQRAFGSEPTISVTELRDLAATTATLLDHLIATDRLP